MKPLTLQKVIIANVDKYAFLNGLSGKEIEDKVSLSHSAWTCKRSGKTALTVPETERLAKVLKVTVNQLLEV